MRRRASVKFSFNVVSFGVCFNKSFVNISYLD
jgi:hypothetical protein